MIFRRVLFPLPLRPTTPIFAPGKKHRLMFLRMVLDPSGRVFVNPFIVNINFLVTASKRSSRLCLSALLGGGGAVYFPDFFFADKARTLELRLRE
jgi:hypothetical protein